MGSQKEAGKKIRRARLNLDLTQVQVAERAKVSIGHYSGIERGEENPTYEVLESIAKVLKVKAKDIMAF